LRVTSRGLGDVYKRQFDGVGVVDIVVDQTVKVYGKDIGVNSVADARDDAGMTLYQRQKVVRDAHDL
jgi:hypothetical protein